MFLDFLEIHADASGCQKYLFDSRRQQDMQVDLEMKSGAMQYSHMGKEISVQYSE